MLAIHPNRLRTTHFSCLYYHYFRFATAVLPIIQAMVRDKSPCESFLSYKQTQCLGCTQLAQNME